MFLCDIAEFGRKVKLSPFFTYDDEGRKIHPETSVYTDRTGKTQLKSGIAPKAMKGSWTFGSSGSGREVEILDGAVEKEYVKRGLNQRQRTPWVETITLPGNTYYRNRFEKGSKRIKRNLRGNSSDLEWVKRGKMITLTDNIKTDPNKKPIRKPKEQIKPTVSTPTPRSSRKLVNKYTLGAAGVLGVGAAGYGGYKLLTRNKKGDKK